MVRIPGEPDAGQSPGAGAGTPDPTLGDDNVGARGENPPDRPNPQMAPMNSKHRTPDLVKTFNKMSLKSKLLFNKIREDNNNRREALRFRRGEDLDLESDVSENDSIYSIPTHSLEPLCDQEVYPIYAEVMPDSVKVRVAGLKRKRPQQEPAGADPDTPPSTRRRIDGVILKAKDAGQNTVQIPDIYFTTEDENAHIPLPLFHPEVIRHVVSNLATIDLMRINPRPGEPKGRVILDIKKLSDCFGGELNISFTFDKYLESASNYIAFQSSRDASRDPLTGAGNGVWSSSWFNHFGFFSTCKETGALYPFWKSHELELREAILIENMAFDASTYEQHFLIARSEAKSANKDSSTSSSSPNFGSSFPSPTSNASPSRQFFRTENKPGRLGTKRNFLTSPKGSQNGGYCLSCSKDHTVFRHLAENLQNSFPDGKPSYCHVTDGTLLLPDGREPCFIFNLASFAKRRCGSGCSRAHTCTFCGGSHAALSWTCRRCPT